MMLLSLLALWCQHHGLIPSISITIWSKIGHQSITLVQFWCVTYIDDKHGMSHHWHHCVGISLILLVLASLHNCQCWLKQKKLSVNNYYSDWGYVTNVENQHDIAIIAIIMVLVSWHHFWHQHHGIIAGVS